MYGLWSIFLYAQLLKLPLSCAIKIIFSHWKCGGIITTICPESIIQKGMSQHKSIKGHCWWPPFPKGGDRRSKFFSLSLGGSAVCPLSCLALKGLALGSGWAEFRRNWSLNSSANFCTSQWCGWQLLLEGKAWILFKVIVVLSCGSQLL